MRHTVWGRENLLLGSKAKYFMLSLFRNKKEYFSPNKIKYSWLNFNVNFQMDHFKVQSFAIFLIRIFYKKH